MLQQLPIKQTKEIFESVAKQRFQKFPYGSFDR
ncbi:hypothetical protein Pse7429DRAFT_1152 [Pseudanabaena biceps PCC 7429]|uniref:Uncharacterized protein n=1 Tax=Pseudanabaena biceps PCC 7429 TaxID=927668 RepID=L8N408_9CYAN|nr:hypothetical protein Pse7429DRAFT_1152 [Pseudanabaena biceps PCC 7429]